MATLSFEVNTHPMAREISSVSTNVALTTGAVVSMKAAVIAAEAKAADHICTNVNRGFYSLIRSQISQKMARLRSEIDSYLLQMAQQRTALGAIRFRMERDYHLIASRYAKLFNSLNVNLRNRIFALDRPVTDFAAKEVEKVRTRVRYLAGNVPVQQGEIVIGGQRLLSAAIKQRASVVIGSMHSFIHEMTVQKEVTERILIGANQLPVGDISIPAMFMESVVDDSGALAGDCWVTRETGSSALHSTMRNAALSALTEIAPAASTAISAEVDGELQKLIRNASCSDRTRKMMEELLAKSKSGAA